MATERFDAVVVGGGPGGEVVVDRLHRRGLAVALVERELVGGECAYWACMPSKTLLRPPEVRSEARHSPGVGEPEQRWREAAEYRDHMIRGLDDSKAVAAYEEKGVRVVRGAGAIAGPGRVQVGDTTVEAERIVIATGSTCAIPDIDGLADSGYWTNREATTLSEVPESAVVLGGGPVGVEVAQMLRRYGASVTLVEHSERLLSREEPAAGEALTEALGAEGIELRLGAEATAVTRENGGRTVELGDGSRVSAQELVVAIGRAPRVDGLGLDTVGIELESGAIPVDERCRAADGVWAVGDVTGILPFTHVAKYQGRLAVRDIAGERVEADYDSVPRVVFTDPEVAAVGLTSEQARERGIDAVEGGVRLAEVARTVTYGRDLDGLLGVLVDRERQVLVGAWAVGPLASEWIHQAVLAIRAQVPLHVLRDVAPQFPSFSEAYQQAFERLEL